MSNRLTRRPRKPKFARAVDNLGIGVFGQPCNVRASVSLAPDQWKWLDTLAKPSPWNGNRSGSMQDLVASLIASPGLVAKLKPKMMQAYEQRKTR